MGLPWNAVEHGKAIEEQKAAEAEQAKAKPASAPAPAPAPTPVKQAELSAEEAAEKAAAEAKRLEEESLKEIADRLWPHLEEKVQALIRKS